MAETGELLGRRMSQTPRPDRDERNAAGSWAFRFRGAAAGIGRALASRSRARGFYGFAGSTGPHFPPAQFPAKAKKVSQRSWAHDTP